MMEEWGSPAAAACANRVVVQRPTRDRVATTTKLLVNQACGGGCPPSCAPSCAAADAAEDDSGDARSWAEEGRRCRSGSPPRSACDVVSSHPFPLSPLAAAGVGFGGGSACQWQRRRRWLWRQ